MAFWKSQNLDRTEKSWVQFGYTFFYNAPEIPFEFYVCVFFFGDNWLPSSHV
jgi:hypothetical protein